MTGTISKREVLPGPERRRRWTPAEKLALVAETCEPGMNVSLVARRQRTNAWDRHQASCRVIGGSDILDLSCHLCDARFQGAHILGEARQQASHGRRQIVRFIGENAWKVGFEPAGALMHRDPVLEAESPHLADDASALGNQTITRPVQGLQVDLLRRPDFDETHRGPGHRLGDGFRIDQIVLVALHCRQYGPENMRVDPARLPVA